MRGFSRHIEPLLPIGSQTISPTGIASGEALGSPTVDQTIYPSGVASGEALGSATVTVAGGPQTIAPIGIVAGEALGSPTIGLSVSPSGIVSGEALGTPMIVRTVAPSGIASGEALGTPTVTAPVLVSPAGIASGEALGAVTVLQSGLTIRPPSIAGAGTLGAPTVSLTGASHISPAGIVSVVLFGVPFVFQTALGGTPGGPPPPDNAPPVFPRNVLIDRQTREVYPWPVNHSSEDSPRGLGRQLSRSGVNPGGFLLRQPVAPQATTLTLHGSMIDRDQQQYATFVRFFNACDDRTFDYTDASGDGYHVALTSFDARRKMSAAHPDGSYFEYSLTLEVLEVNQGALSLAVL